MTRAPEYMAPFEGWRAWSLVRGDEGTYLRSLYAEVGWRAGEALVATCRRSRRQFTRPWRTYMPAHAAPRFTCSCGVYAAFDPAPILRLLTPPGRYAPDEVGRAIGRVALWGEVVECSQGWRASHAYPAHIYVWSPAIRAAGREQALAAIVADLSRYGVPVQPIDSSDERDVLAACAPNAA